MNTLFIIVILISVLAVDKVESTVCFIDVQSFLLG
jgi:hypothetical protein